MQLHKPLSKRWLCWHGVCLRVYGCVCVWACLYFLWVHTPECIFERVRRLLTGEWRSLFEEGKTSQRECKWIVCLKMLVDLEWMRIWIFITGKMWMELAQRRCWGGLGDRQGCDREMVWESETHMEDALTPEASFSVRSFQRTGWGEFRTKTSGSGAQAGTGWAADVTPPEHSKRKGSNENSKERREFSAEDNEDIH